MEEKSETRKENEEIGWVFPASIFAFVVIAWLATGCFLVGDGTGRGTFGVNSRKVTSACFDKKRGGGPVNR